MHIVKQQYVLMVGIYLKKKMTHLYSDDRVFLFNLIKQTIN